LVINHVARIVDLINAHKILVGESEGTRPLSRPRHRWRK